MNRLDLILLLKRHSITVCETPDNVYALEEYTDFTGEFRSRWLDFTSKTYAEVMTWLGY